MSVNQKSCAESSRLAKESLLRDLSKFIPKPIKNFENGKYIVQVHSDCEAGRFNVIKVNDLLGHGSIEIKNPQRTVITALLKVVIPQSLLDVNPLMHGICETGRNLLVIFRYRSSAQERYDMDITDYTDTSELVAASLIGDGINKCPLQEDDPILYEQITNVINSYFDYELNTEITYFEQYLSRDSFFKNLSNTLAPFIVHVEYILRSSEQRLIDKLNTKPPEWKCPRKHFCYGALGSGNYSGFKELFENLADVLYNRFKKEQKMGIIPSSIEEYKKKYREERSNGSLLEI
jgi:hypothetical protein